MLGDGRLADTARDQQAADAVFDQIIDIAEMRARRLEPFEDLQAPLAGKARRVVVVRI